MAHNFISHYKARGEHVTVPKCTLRESTETEFTEDVLCHYLNFPVPLNSHSWRTLEQELEYLEFCRILGFYGPLWAFTGHYLTLHLGFLQWSMCLNSWYVQGEADRTGKLCLWILCREHLVPCKRSGYIIQGYFNFLILTFQWIQSDSAVYLFYFCNVVWKSRNTILLIQLIIIFSRMTLLIRNWMATGNPDSNLSTLFEMYYLWQ